MFVKRMSPARYGVRIGYWVPRVSVPDWLIFPDQGVVYGRRLASWRLVVVFASQVVV